MTNVVGLPKKDDPREVVKKLAEEWKFMFDTFKGVGFNDDQSWVLLRMLIDGLTFGDGED